MAWIHKHINDPYVKKSRTLGYISRAYFKIEAINKKFNIIYRNSQVLDLGACPGGWSQYVMQYTPYITPVDINKNWKFTNIKLIQADIYNLNLSQKFDTILSDIACELSGNNDIDIPCMDNIIYCLLEIVKRNLRVNGHFTCKLFAYNQHIFKNIKMFREQRFFKPEASRADSAEIYFVGKYYLDNN